MEDESTDTITAAPLARTNSEGWLTTSARSTSISSALEALLPDIRSTKELWKVPRLHRDTEISERDSIGSRLQISEHRKLSWHENFLDLVIVASAIQIGHILGTDLTREALVVTSLLFLLLRTTWENLVEYQNTFDTDDVFHFVLYFLISLGACSIALQLQTNHDDSDESGWDKSGMVPLAASVVVCRILMIVLYIPVLSSYSKYRTYICLHLIILTISAALLLGSCFTSPDSNAYLYLWAASIIAERPYALMLVVNYLKGSQSNTISVPVHVSHLLERQGTFIMLTLGEAVIQLVGARNGSSLEDYIRLFLGFALIFNMGDLYYHGQQAALRGVSSVRDKLVSNTWNDLHIILSLSMLFFAAALKLVYDPNYSHGIDPTYFLSYSTGISLFLVFFLRMVHKGFFYKGLNCRYPAYAFRFTLSISCFSVSYITPDATANIATLFVVTSLLVIQDTLTYRVKQRVNGKMIIEDNYNPDSDQSMHSADSNVTDTGQARRI